MQEYKRKLAAIFSADVAGYSRLMGDNEAATVDKLTEYREVMYSLIKQNRGRVIDSLGDTCLRNLPVLWTQHNAVWQVLWKALKAERERSFEKI